MGLFNWQKGKIERLVKDFLYGTDAENYNEDAGEDAYDKLLKIGSQAAKPLLDALKREKDNQVEMWLDGFALFETICAQTGNTNLLEEGVEFFRGKLHIWDLFYFLNEGGDSLYNFSMEELIKIGSSDFEFLISEMVKYVKYSRGNLEDFDNNSSVSYSYYIPDFFIDILTKFKSSIVVDQLIKWLEDVHIGNWKGLIEALVDIGSQSVMPVINILFNSNREIRKRAVMVLGKIGDLRAIEPLINVMQNDSSPDVIFRAAEALERIGGPAVNNLIGALHHQDPLVKKYAAEALGFIGDKRAIDSLITLLKDQDKEVREKAQKVLHKICQECDIDYQQMIKESQIKTIKTIPEKKLNIKNKSIDSLETLKKLKELLNMGAITETEFQMKKNELMKEI